MFLNYIKISLRTLFKSKALSFINIFGLSTGMTFAFLIGLWIKKETGFDKFHQHKDRLALVMKNTIFNNQRNTQESTPLPLHDELKNNYPEVRKATRLTWNGGHSLVTGTNKYNRSGRFVDPDFLDMFTFPLVKGNPATALNASNSIVLTETLASALFGSSDPIGKTVRMDNKFDLQVTGVARDVPGNSTLDFDFLSPYQFVIDNDDWVKGNKTNWSNNFLMNAVELKEGVSMEAFSKKIRNLNMEKDASLKNQTLFLHPLSKWHLQNDFKDGEYAGGKITYVRLFAIIGIFVLLIACINFMNLSTARAETRMKEVGIRKTLGSGRLNLIGQFLSESMLTTFFAFLVSLGLIKLFLPLLANLGFKNITIDLTSFSLLGAALLLCLVTGLIAGSYPALYLSSFLPVRVLKGINKQGKGAVSFRKVLVVSQFSISIGLIICTTIVFQQINHARERAIGYDPNRLLTFDASSDLVKHYAALRQDLLNGGDIESVAAASQPMTATYNTWSDFSWEGKDPHTDIALDAIMAEWDFGNTVGLKLKQGRFFSKNFKTDSNAVILNETALKLTGYKNPIGKPMKLGSNTITIIGIVEDVVLSNPFKTVSPLAIIFNNYNTVNTIFLRMKPTADVAKTLAAIQPVFEKYNPSQPFEYHFTDEEFDKKFTTEKQVGQLAGIFAGMAIFISCLGLFGLALFMAERRNKEIGIRKVLGANIANIVLLLSREFVLLVGLSCLIASPLAFWLMKGWLDKYDYRVGFSWPVFVLAGLGAVAIALITVSFQAIKAAVANPVKSLRSE